MKASSSAPSKYVVNDESRYVSVADVTAMGARLKPYVCVADDLMVTARAVVSEVLVANPEADASSISSLDTFLDALDISMVSHVMSRPHVHGTFKSLQEIGGVFRNKIVTKLSTDGAKAMRMDDDRC